MDILGSIEKSKKGVTKIMYSSNANITTAKKYLRVAIRRGHASTEGVGKRTHYAITDNGLDFLSEWKQYKKFAEELESSVGNNNEEA